MRRHQLLPFLLAASGFVAPAHCQTYSVSAPMTGYCEVDMEDAAGGGDPSMAPWTGKHLNFGTLNETLYYDPVADTLEEVGSVSVSNSEVELAFADAEYISSGTTQLFVTGQVSVGLTIGTIAFDDTSGGTNNDIVGLNIPITGSYTFTTGGDEYTGPLNYSLYVPLYTTVSSVTSTSLTFSASEPGPFGAGNASYLTNFTASNGFRVALRPTANDDTYYYDVSVGPVTAELVPEPSSFLLVALGAAGLTYLRLCGRSRRGSTAR
jgi:hypothetical protein